MKYYSDQVPISKHILKWLLISIIVGPLVGLASAGFLWSLQWATGWREAHAWIIWLLPLGGLSVGLIYHYLGNSEVDAGNNLILERIHNPKRMIPFRMAPMVLLGTVATHLFGGSAGREGTAVQMGGTIADQFSKIFGLRPRDKKLLIIAGVSAGFASVFGTPLAGAIFGLEVFLMGRMNYKAIVPSFLSAIIADQTTRWLGHHWGIHHSHYIIDSIPAFEPQNILYALLAGALFGLAGMSFAKATHFFGAQFKKHLKYPPLRPFVGGIIVAVAVWLLGTTKYIGLGVPTIEAAFHEQLPSYDFIAKLLFTALTLGAGYKGGEVTPLFFIGATLGNALSNFIPLPMALMAGMGFVAVFSGAANTPIATIFMAIELFGAESGIYVALACVTAYLFSGHVGIYKSQKIGASKHLIFGREEGELLGDIRKEEKENA